MWVVVRRCGHGPTIRNHKSLCHVIPEQLRYRYPLSASFDGKPWNGFAYKFNSIFSCFYCWQIYIRIIWATRDPLTTHEDMMDGRCSRREWAEEGAIDLIILLWRNYSLPSTLSPGYYKFLYSSSCPSDFVKHQ